MDIQRLLPADLPRAAEILTRAFQDDPIVTSLLPDPAQRMRGMHGLYLEVLRYVLRFGEAYTTPQVEGVAGWLPPGRTSLSLRGLIATRFGLARAALTIPAHAWPRSASLLAWVEWRHIRLRRPHWYLWILGVQPESQGKGIGSALIAPVLRRADRSELACYLETETEKNVAFYERHGFHVRAARAFRHGLQVWTMLREPASA